MLSKPIKEVNSQAMFPKTNKKMTRRNHESKIILDDEYLGLQLCKRRDTPIMNFNGAMGKISNKTLKRLPKAVKSLKTVRKMIIKCLG